MHGQLYGLGGIHRSHVHDDLAGPFFLDYDFRHSLALIGGHQRTASVCTTGVEAIDMLGLKADDLSLCCLVELAVFPEAGDHWGDDACELLVHEFGSS